MTTYAFPNIETEHFPRSGTMVLSVSILGRRPLMIRAYPTWSRRWKNNISVQSYVWYYLLQRVILTYFVEGGTYSICSHRYACLFCLHPSMKCVRPFVFFLSVFNVFILLWFAYLLTSIILQSCLSHTKPMIRKATSRSRPHDLVVHLLMMSISDKLCVTISSLISDQPPVKI